MTVRRIVTDISHPRPAEAKAFYQDILGLKVVMDQGWIITFQSDCDTQPQISIGSEGGSGTEMPDVSIEVDDVDLVYSRCKEAGSTIKYDLVEEPWGVKRFFVVDPAGKVVNVLAHM